MSLLRASAEPRQPCRFSGCVSSGVFVRKGAGRQTHRDTNRWLVAVPLQALCQSGDGDLSQHPCTSLSGSHEKNSLLSLCHIFWTPSCTQGSPQIRVVVLFLEKVPRVTTLKTGSRPRQGSQWHGAVPQTHHLPQTLKAPWGLSGKASGAVATSLGLGAAPQGHDLGGATEELS